MDSNWLRNLWAKNCQRWRWRTAAARALPDFVILGGMKCGTTSLYETLVQHPQIVSAQVKEVHFFDHNFGHGLLCYRSYFPLAPYLFARKCLSGQPVLTGEASPYYLFHPHVPQRLRVVLPKARLIALLRDPVDRAYSHYRHNLGRKLEPLSFEQALARESERLRGDRLRLLHNEPLLSESYQHFSYVARGIYVDQLRAYHALFPKDQLLILKAEDYFDNPAQTLRQVISFLGLGDQLPAGMKLPGRVAPQPAPAAAAEQLRAFFAPHNERLYQYLGIDFGWGRAAVNAATAA